MRHRLLAALLSMVFALSTPAMAEDAFDPSNASIERLRDALDGGRTSSERLVRHYLDRIARFDKNGPGINALISLNPLALEQARALDEKRKGTRSAGLLEGIPFIVKDNYNTAGLPTTGGSAALRELVPASNAFVVQRLLDQGAVLIGKANMSELAASYGRLGYSSAGGLTLNPFNTARDVSGSSSGSAAAVAADFAAFALGTDTSGSIRGPASVAGLVGLRPTLGLTSRSGIVPLSLTADTSGIIARTARDLAVVLDAMAGADPNDAATLDRHRPAAPYAQALDARPLRGARLGVVANFRGANPEVDAVEQEALQRLRSQGAVPVPITLPKDHEQLWERVLGPVGEAEFKVQFERFLKGVGSAGPRTLAQVIAISASPAVQGSATPVNPARLKGLQDADATTLAAAPAYIRILTEVIPTLRNDLRRLMTENGFDALVFPTMNCPASPRFDRPDPSYVCGTDDTYKAAYIAAASGFPEITVPAGRISANLPVGYSFLGLPDSEATLLSLAHAFQATGRALPPPPLR